MAEFCRSCFVKYVSSSSDRPSRLITSAEPELCEGCGKYKPVVIRAEPRADKGIRSVHPMWR